MKIFLIALGVWVSLFFLGQTAFSQEVEEQVKPEVLVDCDTHLPSEKQSDPTQLTMRGIACFETNQFLKALRFYRQAFRVEPSSVLTAAIGRALQELKLPSLAKPYFIEYLAKEKLSEEAAAKINLQLEKIDAQLKVAGDLNVVTSEPGATVFLIVAGTQWEELGMSPLSIKLSEGNYELMVKKEGFITKSTSIKMVNGKKTTTFVELNDVNQNFQLSQRSWRRTGTYFIYGSVPLLIAGTTLFTIGQIKTNDAKVADNYLTSDPLVKSGSQFKTFGLVTGAVGVVGLIAGIVFYLNGTGGESDPTSFNITSQGISVTHVF